MSVADGSRGPGSLRIRDVVERTGIAEGTLRMWETRYGFPEPDRLESGHRRYRERDVELLRGVALDRDAGLSLGAAIDRARHLPERPRRSVFAGLRERRPELQVHLLAKSTLIGMTHAIEDESAVGAESLLLFGSFQRERFYRSAEARWRELSRTTQVAVVFADFEEERRPAGGPVELPIDRSDPLAREWAIVFDGTGHSACLAAWERPGQEAVPDRDRVFETIWTIERAGAREAARVCCDLTAEGAPDIAEAIGPRLREEGDATDPDDLRRAVSLANRMIAYVGGVRPRPAEPQPAATR